MSRAALATLWWRYVRIPLLVFVPVVTVFAVTPLDLTIAHAFFYDASRLQWIGAHSGWANGFLHDGGRWFVRAIVAAALLLWMGSYWRSGWVGMRRPAAYFVVTAVLAVGLVGLLKTVTHVHCPWDLTEFGGRFPFTGLFGMRDTASAPGRCFPAAHASAGYALLALYFAARERNEALARLALVSGICTGLAFGIGQQSRGAHFLSHDVWSAFIVWAVAASMYTFVFKARLWNDAPDARRDRLNAVPVADTSFVADTVGLRDGARGCARAAGQ